MAKILDASVVVRYLVGDDMQKAKEFARFLGEVKDKLLFLDVTVAEVVWVLGSFYGVSKTEITRKLIELLSCEAIEVSGAAVGALTIFSRRNVSYIDAYLAAKAVEDGVEEIVSYDRDFDKLAGVKRVVP